MDEPEQRSISDRILSLANRMDDPDQSEELSWIAEEIRELERQLEETTTIRRFRDALSSSLGSVLEETFADIDEGNLQKRELAWFLYLDEEESASDTGDPKLITMTIGAGSLRLRCGDERTELDLHELDNLVLKGHQEKVRDMVHEGIVSVYGSLSPLTRSEA
jgi:hypothetical protein